MMKNFLNQNEEKIKFLFLAIFALFLFFLPSLALGYCAPECYGDSGTGCGSDMTPVNECNGGVSACCACGWFSNINFSDIGYLCKSSDPNECSNANLKGWIKRDKFPNTSSYNGNICWIGSASFLGGSCFRNGEGFWDANDPSGPKCVRCDNMLKPNTEYKLCGDTTSLSLSCTIAGDGLCESACGGFDTKDLVCDEQPYVAYPGVPVAGGACINCSFFSMGLCGNGAIDAPEECDPGPPLNLNGKTCLFFGYTGGALACDPTNCRFDKSGCTGGGGGPALCPCSEGTCWGKTKGGLVPCGRNCDNPDTPENECCPCSLCHIFVMLDRIVDFILIDIVPPLAILMLVIAGAMFIVAYFGGTEILTGGTKGGPALLSQAKKLVSSVVTGLVIIYGAWLIVNFILVMLGVAGWVWPSGGWFRIECPLIQ